MNDICKMLDKLCYNNDNLLEVGDVMTAIGIRVTPQKVYFAVIEIEKESLVLKDVEAINMPAALPDPAKLSHIRIVLNDILGEYKVTCAGIKITEPNAQRPNVFRLNIEGVVQELMASSSMNSYFCGQISTLAACLGEERSKIKKYINNELNFRDIDGWEEFKSEEREAIITAVAALEKQELGE